MPICFSLLPGMDDKTDRRLYQCALRDFSLVGVLLLGILCSLTPAWALSITSAVHFTDNFAPNTIPRFPVGQKVQVSAVVNPSDPPTTVTATQGGTTINIPLSGTAGPIIPGVFVAFIDFDPTLTGSWAINATRGVDTAGPVLTNPIPDPEFLPFVFNLQVNGSDLTPEITWTLPDLTGFDIDQTRIRTIEAATGLQIFQTAIVGTPTSFTIPAGVLQIDTPYIFRISLEDLVFDDPTFGTFLENRSNTFTEPFTPTPEPGTLLLLASGLACIEVMRHRRQRVKLVESVRIVGLALPARWLFAQRTLHRVPMT